MAEIQMRRDDVRTMRVVPGEPRAEAVGEGEVQLALDRFGLTANNVTYAVFGDAMSYWKFFPAEQEGWGRVPVWGFADVVASGVEDVAVGERYYGFFPMSSHFSVHASVGGPGLVDVAEHRRELPAIYNDYVRTPADAERLDETILLRPLFGTAFLLESFLRAEGWFGGETVVVSSASSKTAYALAFLLSRAPDSPSVVGLTSSRNREFVESLGVYSRVVAYDDVGSALAEGGSVVFVDIAGDLAVRSAVHNATADRLRHSAVVGASHWQSLSTSGAGSLPGPRPQFFFAPTALERLRSDVGPREVVRLMDEAWDAFLAQVGDWLEISRDEGPEAIERVWQQLVDGGVDPRQGFVLRLE